MSPPVLTQCNALQRATARLNAFKRNTTRSRSGKRPL